MYIVRFGVEVNLNGGNGNNFTSSYNFFEPIRHPICCILHLDKLVVRFVSIYYTNIIIDGFFVVFNGHNTNYKVDLLFNNFSQASLMLTTLCDVNISARPTFVMPCPNDIVV